MLQDIGGRIDQLPLVENEATKWTIEGNWSGGVDNANANLLVRRQCLLVQVPTYSIVSLLGNPR